MHITLLQGVQTTPRFGTFLEVTADEYLDMLTDEVETPSIECKTEEDKKAGWGFVLAQYRKNSDSKEASFIINSSSTEIFCYDIDNMTMDEIAVAMPIWVKYDAALYSTWKHTEDSPRLRLLVVLDVTVPNKRKEDYLPLYLAAAKKLKVKVDSQTSDTARFFLGPQHKPGLLDDSVRYRFKGEKLEISKLKVKPLIEAPSTFDVTDDRPTKKELKNLARKLKAGIQDKTQKIGVALETMLRGESFAPEGSRHITGVNVSFELVRQFRHLDAEWFADTYLKSIWEDHWQAKQPTTRNKWLNMVKTAKQKHSDYAEQSIRQRNEIAAKNSDELTDEQLEEARALRGKLVCSHRTFYYVYSAKCKRFKGPFRSAEVATAFRDCLGAVPGINEVMYSQNGIASLKSTPKLSHEYGTTVNDVYYYAKDVPAAYLEAQEAICLRAYVWNRFDAKQHKIADDLLRTISGEHYPQLEAYFTQFRNLDQPLPALTLVGSKGVWKSRICQIVSRFWNNPYSPTPCRAQQAMLRFNAGLLHNPVIWSDECLATENGKNLAERYRESITERVQSIEHKGGEVVSLFSATRHVISVNDSDKVFSHEIDSASIHATMERFMVLEIGTDDIQAFEDRWEGTKEMEDLREGTLLLEHIRWIEENKHYTNAGRLFVESVTDPEMLLKARFTDDVLYYCWMLAIDALRLEASTSNPGSDISRCAISLDPQNRLRLNPSRLHTLWADSTKTAGTGVKIPSPQKIGSIMTKAGFKRNKSERASNHSSGGWEINAETLEQFLSVADLISWDDFEELVTTVF